MAQQMDLSKWATSNMASDYKMEVKDELPNGDSEGGSKKSNKRMSVERIYQKKTQLEHILLRPDTYIGTIERMNDQESWVYDDADECMKLQKLSYVPGLYKIFDEILVNAADNKQRDPKMNAIKIDIDSENNKIKIWNNGKGIPVVQHKTEKVFVPTLIFGHLLTSSNYDDSEKKVTGGRNGYGAKLCNIFSTKFTVETSCKEYGKHFKQSWSDNMSKAGEPKMASSKGDDFTCITFQPDLKRFGMETLEEDICKVFRRRAFDIAGSVKGVKVFLNGQKLNISTFQDYVTLFVKRDSDGKAVGNALSSSLKDYGAYHYKANERWEIVVAASEKGFQQMSFVNSIATTKGGRHIDHVTDQLAKKLAEVVDKKRNIKSQKKADAKKDKKGDKRTTKKPAAGIKPFQVKNHLWVFVNCLIENPTFDSQTKENMTLQSKNFGSKCELNDAFLNKVGKSEIVSNITNWMDAKDKVELAKTGGGRGKKLKGLHKLDDANLATTKNSFRCTLILTEGDSAKTLAVAGVSEIPQGRDYYGVFPLRGKLLNVRDVGYRTISANQEISDLVKIVGLDYKIKYDTEEEWKKLRYGKIMIMTDQDQDGSHIKGLIINFIHSKWPGLLKRNFIEQFITPIIKATKKGSSNKKKISFYTIPEFEEWRKATPNSHKYEIKYYKGLGTSTNEEGKEYFSDMARNQIQFYYTGSEDDANINLAFSKKKIEERKEWLTNWMEERKRRRQIGLPDLYLYNKDTRKVNFSEFINRELILFSNMDNERSIPSLVDGFKPGQRKVMFVCFKRKLVNEVKVSQLSGSVSEKSAYHHGEASLNQTIIGLAQDFTGSNNLHLLHPGGQFGSRLKMGKDSASPRYITTRLCPLTRLVFNPKDDPLLVYNRDDNKKVEPEWYCPIIPMVLVNGAEGIGTGWSTKVHNHDVREIVRNLMRMIDGEEPREMIPSWRGYTGTIEKIDDTRYLNSGEIAVVDDDAGHVEVTEVPVRMSTNNYKEILEYFLTGEKNPGEAPRGRKKKDDDDEDAEEAGDKGKKKKSEKAPALIKEYRNHCDTNTVKFNITMDPAKLQQSEAQGLHKVFKLQTTLSTNSMVLFDADGVLKKYESVLEILREFFKVRLDMYDRRKLYLEGFYAAMCLKYDNIVRFISEKIDGIIVVENKKKADVIQVLVRRGYDADPQAAWEKTQPNQDLDSDDEGNKKKDDDDDDQDDEDDDEEVDDKKVSKKKKSDKRFDYLLTLPILSLTQERRQKIIKNKSEKEDAMYKLQKTSIQDMWRNDLNEFLRELEIDEAKAKKMEAERIAEKLQKEGKGQKGRGKMKIKDECQPTPNARRVEPRIDPALRLKAAAAAKSKLKAQIKKDTLSRELLEDIKMEIDSDDDDLGLNKSLTDRLGSLKSEPMDIKPTIKQEKKTRNPRAPKDPTKKSPKKANGKGKKKKGNPWSDSEDSDNFSCNEFSDSDEDMNASAPSAPRERTNRRQAGKSKYNFGDSDADDDDNDDFGGDDSFNANGKDDADDDWKNAISDDSDFGLKSSQETNVSKQSESEPEDDLWSRITGKKSPEKKAQSSRPKSPIFEKKAKPGADSDDDRLLNDEPFEVETVPAPAPAPTKKTLGKKPTVPKAKKGKLDEKQPSIFAAMNKASKKSKTMIIESDSEDDSDIEVTKTTKAKRTKRPKRTIVLSDEDQSDAFNKENVFVSSNIKSKSATYSAKIKTKNVKVTQSKVLTEAKPKAAPKRKNISLDSDSDVEMPKKKPAPKKKAAPKKKDIWDSDASDVDDSPVKPAKKRGKKVDSDSEEDFMPKKAKGKAKKKSVDSDDEELDDLDSGNIVPRAAGGRSRRPVAYNFGDSDEEDSDF